MQRIVCELRRRTAGIRRAAPCRRTLVIEGLEQRQLLAGPTIEQLTPLAQSHTAPLDTDVSATYDQAIAPTSVSDQSFAVHAAQSGRLLEPANSLSVSGSTVTLDPGAAFKPGEWVQATATRD